MNNETISDFARGAFQSFLANELTPALPEISNPANRVYLYCHLRPEGEPTRRLLVVSEPGEVVVRVCIEASYQLFDGDTHYHVRRIGSTSRENTAGIEPLLHSAYEELLAWRPTHESIWENVF
jgi:hypothetical protein